MPTSVKSQILTQIATLVATLVGTGTGQVREATRVRTLEILSDRTPSLHWAEGDESPAADAEDNRGYTLEFDLIFKLTIADHRDANATLDVLTPYLQAVIEDDPTLNSLVNWIVYRGDFNWVHETKAPVGGRFLFYRVQYRRLRGDPNTNY